MRRGEDAYVDGVLLRAAEAPHFTVLEDVEQLHLDGEQELPDLVEEQRAALSAFEVADLTAIGAGERATLVPEELALQERFGEGRAVESHERPLRPRAPPVDLLGDHFLADAGLSEDEHGGLHGRELARQVEDLDHRSGRRRRHRRARR